MAWACSRFSTRWPRICRTRPTCRRSKASTSKTQGQGQSGRGRDGETRRRFSRKPDPAEPFCGLVFKVQPYKTGDLAWVRIYSGVLEPNSPRAEFRRATRKKTSPSCGEFTRRKKEEQLDVGPGRRHRRRHRPARFDHGRHAVRHPRADPAGVDRVSRNGHLDGDRAGEHRRSQEAGRHARHAPQAGPDVPGRGESGNRPDAHQRHGRTAPGSDSASAAARLSTEREGPQAARELPRDGRAGGRGRSARAAG